MPGDNDWSGRVLGGYKILFELGRGGMGTVYKAHDPALDRPVALKVLPSTAWSNEDAVARFRKEAQLAASLHHPHIVQIYTLGEYQGVHFYCMEFVKGKTLALLLREAGPLPLSRALQLMIEVCDALIAAHAKNVVHRDLKPGNVMLDEAGRVRILDFGLAKEADVPGVRVWWSHRRYSRIHVS